MGDAALTYNYGEDTRWAAYLETVTFAGGSATEDQLKRVKRKWYKKNVDPDYEAPSSDSGSQQTHTQPPPTSPTGPRQRATGGGGSAPTGGAAGPQAQPGKLQVQAVVAHLKSHPQQTAWLGLNLLAILFLVLGVLPVSIGRSAFKWGLWSLMASYALNVYLSHGRPQFNAAYAQRITPDANLHYLTYCLIFVTNEPMLVPMIPLVVYAVYNVRDYCRGMYPIAYPGDRSEWRLGAYLDQHRTTATNQVGQLEVYIMGLLVVSVFMGRVGIFVPFMYYNFLRLRYVFSPQIQATVMQLRTTVDGYLLRQGVPAVVQNIWHRVRGA